MARNRSTDDPEASSDRLTISGIAFAVWAQALAVGALIHAWQVALPPLSVGPVVAVAAVVVLLRPSSVRRVVALLGALAAEMLSTLPNLWNHSVLVGVLGVAVVAWWVGMRLRSPALAGDPGFVYERLAPYLRTGFILAWSFAALAKYNEGFIDRSGSCAVWILEEIPLLRLPASYSVLAIGGALAVETSIPVLLSFRRTRPIAIVVGYGFHLVAAVADHAAFSGLAWSFYLLFLPPATLARVAVTVRSLARRARSGWVGRPGNARAVVSVFAASWLIAVGILDVLPESARWPVRRWGAAAPCLVWMGAWGWLLCVHRRRWLRASPVGASRGRSSRGGTILRAHDGVLLGGLAVLVLAGASPYLGLHTRAAFTMYSDLRTEPGLWNHLVVPEAVRVFGWQDGAVRFDWTDDPELAAELATLPVGKTVLLDARRLVSAHPGATVRYELDGQARVAAPVSKDPVLGRPVSLVVRRLGAFRPFADGELCLH